MVTKARTLGSAVSAGGVINRDGAIKSYDTVDQLPLSGNTIGDTAYIANFSRVYMWTGAGWFSIALINQNPSFDSGGSPEATYELDSAGGTPTVIQLSATDPEGLPIQWSYTASDSAQYFADITNDSSVFTITAKNTATIQQYDSSGGTFSVTFKASDGVNLATALSEFTIFFDTWGSLSTLSYDSVTFSFASQDGTPRSTTFSSDGTNMYMIGGSSDRVWQYSLSTPWDISTASYASKNFNVTTQESIPYGLEFSSDGTQMYTVGTAIDTIFQYTLATPWDVSTATYNSKSLVIGGVPRGLALKPDGTVMYVVDTGDVIKSYSLSTPYDISTGTLLYTQSNIILDPFDLYFKFDGTRLFLSKFASVHQYSLTTPWDLSTLVDDNISYDFTATAGASTGYMTVKPDGSKLFAVSGDDDSLHQYSF